MRARIWAASALIFVSGASASACYDHDPAKDGRWYQPPAATPAPSPQPTSEGSADPVLLTGNFSAIAGGLGLAGLGTFLIAPRARTRRGEEPR